MENMQVTEEYIKEAVRQITPELIRIINSVDRGEYHVAESQTAMIGSQVKYILYLFEQLKG